MIKARNFNYPDVRLGYMKEILNMFWLVLILSQKGIIDFLFTDYL
ncbi:hypothetical protein EMIT036CA2_170002 [Chryseobacterium sp. IT-36CA2]